MLNFSLRSVDERLDAVRTGVSEPYPETVAQHRVDKLDFQIKSTQIETEEKLQDMLLELEWMERTWDELNRSPRFWTLSKFRERLESVQARFDEEQRVAMMGVRKSAIEKVEYLQDLQEQLRQRNDADFAEIIELKAQSVKKVISRRNEMQARTAEWLASMNGLADEMLKVYAGRIEAETQQFEAQREQIEATLDKAITVLDDQIARVQAENETMAHSALAAIQQMFGQ